MQGEHIDVNSYTKYLRDSQTPLGNSVAVLRLCGLLHQQLKLAATEWLLYHPSVKCRLHFDGPSIH
jgi:hypothetical protein